MSQDKIMLVDNEIEIIQLLRLYLSREGYQVIWTTDSTKATTLAKNEKPDLILLDVVMPGLSGIDLCGKIRIFSDAPIIFLSCKDQDMDKVLGLSIGGDDYITKPFSPTELVARVNAHLRRRKLDTSNSDSITSDKIIFPEGLEINLSCHTVSIEGIEIHLTVKEFELLVLLCKYPGRVFTTKQIFNNIWDNYGIEEDMRTVMVHISNLRKKIEVHKNSPFKIQTVRGVGYKLVSNQ